MLDTWKSTALRGMSLRCTAATELTGSAQQLLSKNEVRQCLHSNQLLQAWAMEAVGECAKGHDCFLSSDVRGFLHTKLGCEPSDVRAAGHAHAQVLLGIRYWHGQ